jgi:hypothetical protein
VNDTQEASSGKKSKKAHRGYAFIVYEREKDMKGIPLILFPQLNLEFIANNLSLLKY